MPVQAPRPQHKPARVAMEADIEAQANPGRTQTRAVPLMGHRRTMLPPGWDSADKTRDYNPDDIGYPTLDRMRSEPTIATGLTLLETPVLRQTKQARIECDDPSIKRFLEATLLESGVWYDMIKASLHALWAGMQACEKVWIVKDLDLTYDEDDSDTGETLQGSAWQGPALVLKELREINPMMVQSMKRRVAPAGSTASMDANGKPFDGSFDGFVVRAQGTVSGKEEVIAPQKAFLYTHGMEFGNLWGKPRIRNSYSNNHWLDYTLKCWAAWIEKKIVPPRLVRYEPGETIDDDGQTIDNSDLAMEVIEGIDVVNAVAFPSTTDEHGKYLWDVTEFPTTDRTQVFKDTATYHAAGELLAMFVPERVFTNNEVGSYSAVNAYQDLFLVTLDALMTDLTDNGNAYLTLALVYANFGHNVPDARVVTPGLTDAQKARLEAVLTALLADPAFLARIDADVVARDAEIPLKPPAPASGPVDPTTGLPLPPTPPGFPPQPASPPVAAGPGAPAPAAPAAAPGAPPAAGTPALAETVKLAVSTFDASRWDVRTDSTAALGYAVYDKQVRDANGKPHRITGFAAAKVYESYQKAQAVAGKKAAVDQAKASRAAAALQRKAETTQRKQERDRLKQQKELERQQKAAAATQAKEHQQILAGARSERQQLESSTRRQSPADAARTLAAGGWTQVAGPYGDRPSAEAQAHAQAKGDASSIYTVISVAGGFVVAKKPKQHIITAAQAPNVVASDRWGQQGSDPLADIQEWQTRLRKLMVTELSPDELEEPSE